VFATFNLLGELKVRSHEFMSKKYMYFLDGLLTTSLFLTHSNTSVSELYVDNYLYFA